MECPICFEEFDAEKTAEITSTLCCKQNVHENCINAIIVSNNHNKRNTPCPFCRSDISVYVDPPDIESVQTSNEIAPLPEFYTQIRYRCSSASFQKRTMFTCCSFFFFQVVVLIGLFWVPVGVSIS